MEAPDAPDHYEMLQVSPRAHPLVITRAFRLLVAMYHPDNKDTGDDALFRKILQAYRVVSDPVRRAAYDRETFGTASTSSGARTTEADVADSRPPDERQLRLLILHALYDNRRSRPHRPGLSLMVLSELSECSIEGMQFTLWYLRGKKLIEVGNDEELLLTVTGVDHVEAGERPDRAAAEMLALPPVRDAIESRSGSSRSSSSGAAEPSS